MKHQKALILLWVGFGLTAATTLAQSINVTTTGVGIGTTTPSFKLHVNGVPGVNGDVRANLALEDPSGFAVGSGPGIVFRPKFNSGGTYWDAAGIKGIKENGADGNFAGALSFQTSPNGGSPTERLRINSNGNVGIGTTTPQARLSLAGSVAYDTNDSLNFVQLANNSYSIQTLLDARGLSDYGTYGGDENRLFLQPLVGWVGIGTQGLNNGGHKLVVNGTVKSKGFVTDTSNWADYVFDKDYKLPTLQEVEQHIESKGHLPGIPSEKEVLANGFNIGEMQAKLLAQIEQLTLHVIALNKQVEAQKDQMETQKDEIEVLKAIAVGCGISVNSSSR